MTDDPAVAEKAADIAPVQVIPENLLTIYKIESQLKKRRSAACGSAAAVRWLSTRARR